MGSNEWDMCTCRSELCVMTCRILMSQTWTQNCSSPLSVHTLLWQSKDEPDAVFYVPLPLDLKGLPDIDPEVSNAGRPLWLKVCWVRSKLSHKSLLCSGMLQCAVNV